MKQPAIFLLVLFMSVSSCGCHGSWYKKFNWKAEDYFSDAKVIALCHAIEARDIAKIDKLVAEGADVNAIGKGNMTPLLWAFPENKPEVFKRLLEHGADPNVGVTSDFNTRGQGILPGDSVLHMAAATTFPDYFKYVMQHGGNPNLIRENRYSFNDSPLITVIMGNCPNKAEAVQLLIDSGADLDYMSSTERTSLSYAISVARYDLAIQLLLAGASFNICKNNGQTIVHDVLSEKNKLQYVSEEYRKIYHDLVDCLKEKGADFEGAAKDNKIWKNGNNLSSKRIAELKKIYADELEAKKAKAKK